MVKSTLDIIKEKLLEIDKNVFYGAVGSEMKNDEWNYIVFGRDTFKKNQKLGFSDYYKVAVVREDYIPDGLAEEVINKLEEIPGMKLAGNDMQYHYEINPSSQAVVEMVLLDFVKARK